MKIWALALLLATTLLACRETKFWIVIEYPNDDKMYYGFFAAATSLENCIKEAKEIRKRRKDALLPSYSMECGYDCKLKGLLVVCDQIEPIKH